MKGLMNRRSKRSVALLLAFFMMITMAFGCNVMSAEAAVQAVSITECGGYEEGAYAEWTAVEGADGYKAYVSKDGSSYTAVDNELIRQYADYWRVDTVGLTAGTYYIKVEAVKVDETSKEISVLSSGVTGALEVTHYDRSGFSFSEISRLGTGSGAYNDDGSLKSGAQVVYVTADTAKTCTATVNGTEQIGIQAILDAKQKSNTSNDILCIRIIGCVEADDVDKFSSSSEGIQIKGKSSYTPMNITIEGIGEDAAVSGFGFLVRNCGNIEFRNFAIMNFMDDGISLDTDNTNIWIHDMDFFYGSVGGDADQAKGDGTVDMKGDSQYITVSYNHFWDSGKASLCGMKSETGENYITYHHNWFDHSDSRHPRIRTMSVHVYNNYYDGNSKYGVGAAYQSQAFVEANYFNNCKYPMLISMQGSDIATDGTGTFSGEDGGIIKAYNNIVVGAKRLIYANSGAGTGTADSTEFDAYLATTRGEQVPAGYAAKQGGKVYNNFDTSVDLGVDVEDIDAPEAVPEVVTAKAGRLAGGDFKWDLSAASEDSNYAVISEFKTAITNYTSSVVSIGGISGNASSGGSGDGSGSTGDGDDSGSTGDDDGDTTEPVTPVEGAQIHNFSEDGKESSFFNISGNLSTSKGTVTYNGLTLTQCLKMETATNISFASDKAGTLTLVFKETAKKVKVDGEKYTLETNVLTVDLAAGEHTITKGDSINLFYMIFTPEAAEEVTPEPEPMSDVEAFVRRMYTVALGREAEAEGVAYWTARLLSLEDDGAAIARGFFVGDEFVGKNYSNREYLNVLYQTFFSREADTEGEAYWSSQLENGKTRESVLAGFVNSDEFFTLCADYGISRGYLREDGSAVNSGVYRFTERLYTKVLERSGEKDGIEYWVIRMDIGACSPEDAAKSFFESNEYLGKQTSDEKYIMTLYHTFMDREAEADGLTYWKNVLNSGTDRQTVLSGFANSDEFKEIMAEYGL